MADWKTKKSNRVSDSETGEYIGAVNSVFFTRNGVIYMEPFMNVPELISATANNIIEEYSRYPNVKHVAKVYNITVKEVRDVLKQAGIRVAKIA